jgi:SAM-dependent methyltransferase
VTPLPDLRSRAREAELLDVGVPDAEALRSLADLRFVNRWLANRTGLLASIRPYLAPGARLLDVGCASGDMLAFFASRGPGPLLTVGLDVKVLHLRGAPALVRGVVGDARALPFAERSFDVVTASHFLHHFETEDLPRLLRGLYALARRALVVSDLRRAAVPYLFGRALFPALLRSPVSVSDGLVSIRRGFRPEELRAAFAHADLPAVRVERQFPYRLVVVAERPVP